MRETHAECVKFTHQPWMTLCFSWKTRLAPAMLYLEGAGNETLN